MGLARVITSILKSVTGMFQVVELNDFKEVSATDINRLKVNTQHTGVYLIPSDQENITMELKGQVSKRLENAFVLDVTQNKEALNILIPHWRRSRNIVFGFIMDRSKLFVRVPEKNYESLILQTSSGDIECEGIKSNTFSLTASSGDIRLKGAEVTSDLSIQSSSGSIHANDLQSNSKISLQASSGNVHAKAVNSNELRMKANSGNVNVREAIAKEVILRTSSGEIRARDINGDLTAEASSGNIDITNNELIGKWALRSSSGDVSVKLVKPDSLSINFKGGSGDGKIKVNGMNYQVKSEHSIIGKIGDGVHQLNVQTSSGDFRLS